MRVFLFIVFWAVFQNSLMAHFHLIEDQADCSIALASSLPPISENMSDQNPFETRESPLRRFEILFLVSYPFSVASVFAVLQLYGLSNQQSGVFQFNPSHIWGVLLGGGVISFSVAWKGMHAYQQQNQYQDEMAKQKVSYHSSESFQIQLPLLVVRF